MQKMNKMEISFMTAVFHIQNLKLFTKCFI